MCARDHKTVYFSASSSETDPCERRLSLSPRSRASRPVARRRPPPGRPFSSARTHTQHRSHTFRHICTKRGSCSIYTSCSYLEMNLSSICSRKHPLHPISKTALINHDGLPVSFFQHMLCLKSRNYYFLLKKVSDWTQLMTVTPVWWQGTQ